MSSTTRCFALALTILALAVPALRAQDRPGPPPPGPAGPPPPLRVYLDCQTWGCDFDYFRTAVPWVDWMRDRQDANVHVLLTSQQTGGGGTQFTLTFLGRGVMERRADTLTYAAPATNTDDEVRKGLVQRLRVGLVPFAARTVLLERLTVSAPGSSDSTTSRRDPWNHWVFSVSADPDLSGEVSYRSLSLWGSVTATRVTPRWKARISFSDSYSENEFKLSEGSTRTVTRSYVLSTLTARSLSPHWSAGLLTTIGSSSYSNYVLAGRVAPGIEWDLFPYDESTRRQLTVLYTVGADYYHYREPTIYRKRSDRLLDHSVNASLQLRQPWGSVSTSAQASQFLNWRAPDAAAAGLKEAEAARYALTVGGGFEVRLLKGLSLDVHGDYDRIHNQINLPASGASDEDILLRLRQLETSYRYYVSAGLRFTFGSIHNNIVNPRFSRTSQGTVISF